jgi:dTMP kinase
VQARFITLEGGEGVGKTTNLAFIERYLQSHGVEVLRTREPGGTPLGEVVRSLLLDSAHVDSRAELLLVFAARAQHIAEIIRPALDAGHWVISDRFTDASYAYQGGGRGIETSVIGFLEHWVQQELQPDLTLLLDSPLDVGMARARGRGNVDRFESEQEAFFERVRQVYLDRAAAQPQRIKRVDASGSLEDVQVELARHLDQLLESSR